MIRIFTSPSCSSCRKVKAWFDEQKIPYEAVNIFGDDFTKDDIRELIAKKYDLMDLVEIHGNQKVYSIILAIE